MSVSHISEIYIHDNHGHATTSSSKHNDKKHEEVHEGTLVELLLNWKKITVSRLTIYNFILPLFCRGQLS